MRLTDHEINPILSPCLAWFGGGKRGPSKQEQQQAQQQQNQMQQAAVDQAAAQQRQMELNKPAPGAQVVQGDAEGDMRRQAAQRRGMRRSILAGESDQGAGDSSTLG